MRRRAADLHVGPVRLVAPSQRILRLAATAAAAAPVLLSLPHVFPFNLEKRRSSRDQFPVTLVRYRFGSSGSICPPRSTPAPSQLHAFMKRVTLSGSAGETCPSAIPKPRADGPKPPTGTKNDGRLSAT